MGNMDLNRFGTASDYDGSNLVACVFNGMLYTSSNYGVSRTQRNPTTPIPQQRYTVCTNATGSRIMAAMNT